MRHRSKGRKLSRTSSHRTALLRNLVTSLFEHESITTTLAKAKETRPAAEKLITMARRNDLHSRRIVASYVRSDEMVAKLFNTIAPWYAERPGGYTRITKLGRRLGDAGEMAIISLVKSAEQLAAEAPVVVEEAPKRRRFAFGFGARKTAPKAAAADAAPAAAPNRNSRKEKRDAATAAGQAPKRAMTRARKRAAARTSANG